jgi:antibiotic biosynthesis monooxygenase (ABM) superfamily enzyme
MKSDATLTVTIRRRVKSGREAEFEKSLREFVPQSIGFPGHLGVQVLNAAPEWIGVIKFQNRGDYESFRDSPEYRRWNAAISDLLDGDPVVAEQRGLESWFGLPGKTSVPVMPLWKMAIVTWLGVNVAVNTMTFALRPVVGSWPFIPQSIVVNAFVVVLLTWIIMPLLTRCFRSWLYRPDPSVILEPNRKALP